MKSFNAEGTIIANGNVVKVILETNDTRRKLRCSFSREFLGTQINGEVNINIKVNSTGTINIVSKEKEPQIITYHPETLLAIQGTVGLYRSIVK